LASRQNSILDEQEHFLTLNLEYKNLDTRSSRNGAKKNRKKVVAAELQCCFAIVKIIVASADAKVSSTFNRQNEKKN
jgi:hypothetical protein